MTTSESEINRLISSVPLGTADVHRNPELVGVGVVEEPRGIVGPFHPWRIRGGPGEPTPVVEGPLDFDDLGPKGPQPTGGPGAALTQVKSTMRTPSRARGETVTSDCGRAMASSLLSYRRGL